MASSHEQIARIVDRFLEHRGSGRRLSIDDVLADFPEVADRATTRADVLRYIAGRRRGGGPTIAPTGSSASGQPGPPPSSLKSQALVLDASSASRASSLSDGFPELDGYDIIDELGRGGMGRVYEAYQQSTGRRVAIKFMLETGPVRDGIHVPAAAAARQRFEREVELIARLQHPSIVSVMDSGVHRGSYFYVMEYFDGQPLDVAVPPGTKGPREVLPLITAICDAVDYAHQRGVLHRDLKPGNILVVDDESSASADRAATGEPVRANAATKAEVAGRERSATNRDGPVSERGPLPHGRGSDRDGRGSDRALNPQPKILDFGLAKALDSGTPLEASLSQPGQIIGTLGYMSPEQARGRLAETSVRSDVYSLGAIAYELITGSLPCPVSGPLADVFRRIEHEDPKPPSQHTGRRDRDLDAMLLKALEKSPSRRYATAGEFAADIRRYLEDRPITARPVSAAERATRWARRHRGVAGVGAVSLILIIGIVMAAFVRVTTERDAARREAQKNRDVAGFWAEAFDVFDLDRRTGAQRPLRDSYNSALKLVQKILVNNPEAQSRILTTIGKGYSRLGHYDEADAQLRQVVALQKQLEPDSVQFADSLINQCANLYDKGDYDSAEKLIRDALVIHRKHLGDEHLTVADDLEHLGLVLMDSGRTDEAADCIQRTIDLRRAVVERGQALNDPQKLGDSYHNLGRLRLNYQGRAPEAEGLLRRALGIYEETLEDSNPESLAKCRHALAVALVKQGKLADAEPLSRSAVDGFRQVFPKNLVPEGSEDLIATVGLLGEILLKTGRASDAEPLLLECWQWLAKNAPGETQTGHFQSELGESMTDQGRYVEAEEHLKSGYAIVLKQLGTGQKWTNDAARRLHKLYTKLGKPDQAKMYEEPASPLQSSTLQASP